MSPGFHLEGPQGLIDSVLKIDECDILIGMFWHKWGTPVADATSGTAHEFRTAYNAWKVKGRPQIMVYFKTAAYTPKDSADAEQWAAVLQFRKDFPSEGLYSMFRTTSAFEQLIRQHLNMHIMATYGPSPDRTTVRGDQREN